MGVGGFRVVFFFGIDDEMVFRGFLLKKYIHMYLCSLIGWNFFVNLNYYICRKL